MLADFTLVTGNQAKALEVERLLGRRPPTAAIDLPELQSLDLVEVVEGKAREAWRRLGRPVVVEDTGLFLDALNGFPGPLVKWLLASVGPEGIWRLAAALGDCRAQAVCQLGFFDGERLLTARGSTPGELVAPRGSGGFGWDSVFQPRGTGRTYAEIDDDDKDRVGHRGLAWRALATLTAAVRTR